jgi:hypothetical protein
MATNLARLKGKGAPPAAEIVVDVISDDPRPGLRDAAEPQRPIQVRVPESIFAEFSERAGREFGFTHGAKKQLFLKMWKAYMAQNR